MPATVSFKEVSALCPKSCQFLRIGSDFPPPYGHAMDAFERAARLISRLTCPSRRSWRQARPCAAR
eukprot:6185462-Pleurochrysis_carterae.AAC.1